MEKRKNWIYMQGRARIKATAEVGEFTLAIQQVYDQLQGTIGLRNSPNDSTTILKAWRTPWTTSVFAN